MKYSLLALLLLLTVLSLFFGLARQGPAVFVIVGLWLAMLIWQLVQFGRDISDPK
jgi:hypothetical protein